MKEDEELPPLPWSLSATSIGTHHVFTNCRGYDITVSGEGKEQEPVQDAIYEPITFHTSDKESYVDESQGESQSLCMYTLLLTCG